MFMSRYVLLSVADLLALACSVRHETMVLWLSLCPGDYPSNNYNGPITPFNPMSPYDYGSYGSYSYPSSYPVGSCHPVWTEPCACIFALPVCNPLLQTCQLAAHCSSTWMCRVVEPPLVAMGRMETTVITPGALAVTLEAMGLLGPQHMAMTHPSPLARLQRTATQREWRLALHLGSALGSAAAVLFCGTGENYGFAVRAPFLRTWQILPA